MSRPTATESVSRPDHRQRWSLARESGRPLLFQSESRQPILTLSGHGDVSRGPHDGTAIEKGHPTNFWQVDPVVFTFEALRVPKGISANEFLFERWELLFAALVESIV